MREEKEPAGTEREKTHLVRDSEAWDNVELFLVSAVISILLIRAFLKLAGYPSISGEELHIAHIVWGGVLMLAAVMILLVWWNPAMRRFGAFIAGLGFGTFIDEIGKFITHDNDYFFKPTAMILYTLFMLLFISARSMIGNRPLTASEERANSRFRGFFPETGPAVSSVVDLYFRGRDKLAGLYRKVVLNRWFKRVLTAGFIISGISGLFGVIRAVIEQPGIDPGVSMIQLGASAASNLCIWTGIWMLRRSRLRAYIWFKRSVLINIYITQIFVFYHSQFAGLGGLAEYLLLYSALHFMIKRER
jgi:hypothetical protein